MRGSSSVSKAEPCSIASSTFRSAATPTFTRASFRARADITAKVSPVDGIADALALDDAATIHGAANARQTVLLVASDAAASPTRFFVEKAIAAAGSFQIVPTSLSLDDVKLDSIGVAVVLAAPPARKLGVPALYLGTAGGSLPFMGFRDLDGDSAHLRSIEAKDPLCSAASPSTA